MQLKKLESLVEKSFLHYQKARDAYDKTRRDKIPNAFGFTGDFSLFLRSCARASRYLKLRRLLEQRGGSFGGNPPLRERD